MTVFLGTLHLDLVDGPKEVSMLATRYTSGNRLALVLQCDDGSPWGMLTVNFPDVPLAHDEILVKTWSENSFIRGPALDMGLFEDTGRRLPAGFVEAEVWRFTGKVPDVH